MHVQEYKAVKNNRNRFSRKCKRGVYALYVFAIHACVNHVPKPWKCSIRYMKTRLFIFSKGCVRMTAQEWQKAAMV